MARIHESEWPLASAEAMRALDWHTIEKLGVPGELLMECAGRLVAAVAEAELAPGGRVVVLCGPGNNGGDGFVAARHLHLRGVPVSAVLAAEPGRVRGDAARNLERAERVGVPFAGPRWRAEAGDVVVDALFGTGLARALEGDAASAVKRILAARPACRVVAVDLPSGLDADTGQPLGPCVAADVTVAISLPKLALALEPGRSLAGRVVVGRIGIADEAPGVALSASLLTRRGAAALRPVRPRDGHKGRFGHVLVAAGSRGKTGAAALAAEGALRAGAGLVTFACPAGADAILQTALREAMTAPLAETADGELAASAADAVLRLAAERDALVLGPGLGRSAEPRELVRRTLRGARVPIVLDADGLVAFAGEPDAIRERSAPAVLTPHPGEAGALLGLEPAAVNRDRVGTARRLAEQSGAVVVLKGAATVIADPDGRVRVNPTGGPVLGTGGTGDVLAGAIGGLLAQGLAPFDAASAGVYLHGAAGDRLAAEVGRAGVAAGDVARALPAAAEALRRAAEAGPAAPAFSAGGIDALAFPEPEETRAAARELAEELGGEGGAVALLGDLGAGKTAFAKGVAEGLGIPPELVASPTFTIAQELPAPGGLRLVHADLFRVESRDELEAAGFDDWLAPDVVLLVEWADRLPGALPDDHLEVHLERGAGEPDAREVAVRAHGRASTALLARWRARRSAAGVPLTGGPD